MTRRKEEGSRTEDHQGRIMLNNDQHHDSLPGRCLDAAALALVELDPPLRRVRLARARDVLDGGACVCGGDGERVGRVFAQSPVISQKIS